MSHPAAGPSTRSDSPLRLPTGQVTAVLGATESRREVLRALDEATAVCTTGQRITGVYRLAPDRADSLSQRLGLVRETARRRPHLVLCDRLTDDLDGPGRREVLAELRALAMTGAAVLVNDHDPVAALAVADRVLRVAPDGSVMLEDAYARAM